MRLSNAGVKRNLSAVKNLATRALLRLASWRSAHQVDRNGKGAPIA